VKIPVALEEDEETHEIHERETFAAPYIKDIKDEYIQAALDLRRTQSIKSKYLDKYLRAIDSSNVLRYSLHQLRGDDFGTVTGRFSCGGGKHSVNIQQVMKCEKQIEDFGPDFIIRELFIPEVGAHLFSSDASQIEFRLFAHYSGSERLIRAYNEDAKVDFHQIVTDMIRIFIDICRREAKHINFGKLYGMGLKKLCARLLLSEDDGRKLLAHYDEAFPEAGRLLRKAADLAKKRGFVKTLLNRRRRYPDARRLHSALNAVIQGGAADYFKLKLRELYDARKELDIKLRMPVHDEFVGDLLSLSKQSALQERLDFQSLPLRVPLIWDTKVGTDWRLGEGQAA
jgi:DNA polymerase I-like protein with 3'-5' exonuclease and polymerase domains